jgi:ketosteroid isomerase-like protein
MSQENVELVRKAYDLDIFTASSGEIVRYFRDYGDEKFEFHLPPDYPEGEPVFRGRDGASRLVAMMKDVWGEWRFEPEQFIDAGDRGVVVFARILAQGLASGVPIELQTAHVWTVRGGRATSVHMFRDRTEALEAAGLRE